MADFRIATYTMPAANLGPENPLPQLRPRLSATAAAVHESVPAADCQNFGYGLDAGWLPHRALDDYDRSRTNRDFFALVLENEFLRATILPEIGGRLWSLIHLPTGRELLHANHVFQPANLAVRGAWVAGGVEWNACVYGHSPYNCSSMFAALVEDDLRGPVVRLYEWDRTRCVPYQLDLWLDDRLPYLFVRVRLSNPHEHTVPMYWWSNIAVPESESTRVLAPAHRAYTYEYGGTAHSINVPQHGDFDFSYPVNIPYPSDYFFRIPDGHRPWIAALDRKGNGLVQTSTSRQVGRKLFAWGNRPGGRRWQEFLSSPEQSYFEIQAGLARTQMECSPMPAGACWEWLEAYGYLETNPVFTHSDNWDAAIRDVDAQLARLLPQQLLESELAAMAPTASRSPAKILHRGSGWGALERLRREHQGEPPFCSTALNFDNDSITADQQPWLSLLYNGVFPDREPSEQPGAWMIQPDWQHLLQASLKHPHGDHWLAHLHLGLIHLAAGDLSAAADAWRQSIVRAPSAWAYRNLAALRQIQGRTADALDHYASAHNLLPSLHHLVIEYCELLLSAGRADEALALINASEGVIRRHSRLQLLKARTELGLGQIDQAASILSDAFELVDIREGETSLTDLWSEYHQSIHKTNGSGMNGYSPAIAAHDLPFHIDFRITPHPAENASPPKPHFMHSASQAAFVSRDAAKRD